MLAAVLSHFITEQVARYGLVGVFALMLLGSACIPIPSEVVMAFGGALASPTFASTALGDPGAKLGLAAVMLVGLVGSLIGSWLAYWAGYAGGRPLIDRWGRYLLLRPHEVDRAHEWFERRGEWAVCFLRLVPLIRAFISLPAGVARMSFRRFTLFTLLGIVPWTVGLAVAGYWLGESWDTIERFFAPLAIAAAVLLVGGIAWWVWQRRETRSSAPEPRTEAPDDVSPET